MRKLYCKSGTGIGLALLPAIAFAAQLERIQADINTAVLYAVLLFAIVVGRLCVFHEIAR